MTNVIKRSLALALVLVMCISFLPIISLNASAADITYVYDGNYIYNWGERGETATSLSPNAMDFYTGSNSYDVLSAYAGGTGTSDAPNSDLYKALQKLMKDSHTYITSYDATKNLFKYTDCQNSGGKISSFYSGKEIGPSWDGGWNREHTWPNSKGLGGSDENDLMMLRPTSTSENSSRGNKAYGQSSGYYNPNSESGGAYDLRGDVARIFLYVYVRWGNVNGNGSYTTWGSSGVMESLDVMLTWMEEDPVDTWELGRNDSVESIIGTRNVFVDYPELAFILFGEEIPDGMVTPSGEAGSKCNHNNFDAGVTHAPNCTEKGYILYTCQTEGCTYSYKANVVNANGHNFVSGTCTVCGEAEPVEPAKPTYVTSVTAGEAYKLGIYSSANSAEYYFSGTMNGYYGATDTNYDNGVDVYVEETSGGYYMYFTNAGGQKQYINLVISGTYYNFTFAASPTSVYTWDAARNTMKTTLSGEVCYIGTYGSYVTMGVLKTSKLQETDYIARFYTFADADEEETPDTSCEHNYTASVTDPSCTEEGYTTYTCSLCSDTYTADKTPATGHRYKNDACVKCSVAKPANTEADIGFTDTANRTEFSTTKQVWVQNGITITNEKAGAQNDVADYKDPVRFYKGSKVTIEFPGMTKIVIDCSGLEAKYVNSWLEVSNGTATNNGGIITIVFNTPVDSLVYESLSAQSRAFKITAYSEQVSVCEHTNTAVDGASDASCTVNGHTGLTYCADCFDILDEGEDIIADGHEFGEWLETTPASCTGAGELRRDCNNCDHYETDDIPQLEHADEDGDNSCDTCGKSMSEGSDDNNNTDNGNTGNGDNTADNDGGNNTVIIVILCVVVGVAAIAAVAAVIFKKKRS